MTKLIRLTAFVLLVIFPSNQIIFANPAFSIPLSDPIVPVENYSAGHFLKDGGFSAVRDMLKSGIKNLIDKINPVTYFKEAFTNITKTVKDLSTRSGLSKLIETNLVKVGLQIAQSKVDQLAEKSKMGALMKAVLSTVSTVGFQAIGGAFIKDAGASGDRAGSSRGSGSARTGLAAVFETIKNIGGVVSSALKDAAGFVKSIFIRDSASLPSGAGLDLGDLPYDAEIIFGTDGHPIEYRPLLNAVSDSAPDIGYEVKLLQGNYYRSIDDLGNITETQISGGKVLSSEKIGNLESPGFFDRFNDLRYSAADLLTETNNRISNFILDEFYGATTYESVFGKELSRFVVASRDSTALKILIGREFANGIIDTLRLGDQLAGIKSDFFSARASFQKGDYFGAAKNLGSAGLKGLTEGGRILNIVGGVAGTVKGVGKLGNLFNKLKFGADDLLYGIYNQRFRNFQKTVGGTTLADIIDKLDLGRGNLPGGKNIVEFSLDVLNKAAKTGRKIRFDITDVTNLDGVIKGTHYPNAITSQELRHIYENWDRFKKVVTFYKDGKKVKAW